MKNLAKTLIVGIGVAALAMACEPGGGGGDAETGGTVNPGNDGTTNPPPAGDDYPAIEIFDDKANETLNPCDSGALATPGADIDAGELMDGGTLLSNLSGCSGPTDTVSCANDMNNASLAEGAPDGDKENGFVSLDGGKIRCGWDSGGTAKKGLSVSIYEIGGAGGGKIENYGVRLCKNTGGNCLKDSGYGTGNTTIPVDSLF